MPEIMNIGQGDLNASLKHVADTVAWTFLIVSSATILIVLVDVPQQLWQHSKKLKMTREQIKQEHKDTEGMPEVKVQDSSETARTGTTKNDGRSTKS